MTKSFRAGGCAGLNYSFLTLKERDNETGLDYFLARYYSSTQGRFTGPDPENAGADSEDPQSWNGYGYARSSPLVYSDPDGREYLVCDPDGGNCRTVSDNDFWAERKAFEKTGNVYTGNRDFFESGQIKNADGDVVASYVQTSIDDLDKQYIFAIRRNVAPIPQATLEFFKLSVDLGAPAGVVRYFRTASTITTLGLEAGGTAGETATIAGRTVNLVGKGVSNTRAVGSGRLAGYLRGDTNLSGGNAAARATFRQLTGRDPVGAFDRVVQGGKEVVYRAMGGSGHSKIEAVDHAQRFLEKITFR